MNQFGESPSTNLSPHWFMLRFVLIDTVAVRTFGNHAVLFIALAYTRIKYGKDEGIY